MLFLFLQQLSVWGFVVYICSKCFFFNLLIFNNQVHSIYSQLDVIIIYKSVHLVVTTTWYSCQRKTGFLYFFHFMNTLVHTTFSSYNLHEHISRQIRIHKFIFYRFLLLLLSRSQSMLIDTKVVVIIVTKIKTYNYNIHTTYIQKMPFFSNNSLLLKVDS